VEELYCYGADAVSAAMRRKGKMPEEIPYITRTFPFNSSGCLDGGE